MLIKEKKRIDGMIDIWIERLFDLNVLLGRLMNGLKVYFFNNFIFRRSYFFFN